MADTITTSQPMSMAAERIFSRQVELLRALISCRSVSSPLPTAEFTFEARLALDLIGGELAELGFVSERWLTRRGFPTLAARRSIGEPGTRPVIGFNGHLDVVPIENPAKWACDPWGGEIIENRMVGRGACDAKGAVVAMIGALRVMRDAGIEPATDLLLHIVTDEEVAGDGTDECLERGWPDAVIVGEPSDLDVWIAEPGLEHLRIEIDGLATHALNRWRALPDVPGCEAGGVNAIDKAAIVAEAIRDLERSWTRKQRYPLLPERFNTINLGAIVGGKSGGAGEINAAAGPGSVPDCCALEYNIWYYPTQPLEDLQAELEAHVLAACANDWWLAKHPPRFVWALRGLTNPPAETDPGHPLAAVLHGRARQIRPTAVATAMQGASLLPWYTSRGIPGVIFGPGNVAQAHAADEFLDLASLRETTLVLASTLADTRLKEVPRTK